MFNKLISFFQEARQELARVNWPTRQETIRLTATVVGISLLFAVFLGALDFAFADLLKLILLR